MFSFDDKKVEQASDLALKNYKAWSKTGFISGFFFFTRDFVTTRPIIPSSHTLKHLVDSLPEGYLSDLSDMPAQELENRISFTQQVHTNMAKKEIRLLNMFFIKSFLGMLSLFVLTYAVGLLAINMMQENELLACILLLSFAVVFLIARFYLKPIYLDKQKNFLIPVNSDQYILWR